MGNNTTLNSLKVTISAPPQEVLKFLSVADHHQHIIPQEAVHFVAEHPGFSYHIPGTGDLSMMISHTDEHSVVLIPWKKVPFPYKCTFSIHPLGVNSILEITLEAELNPILKMVAVKPLQNLIQNMSDKILKYFEGI